MNYAFLQTVKHLIFIAASVAFFASCGDRVDKDQDGEKKTEKTVEKSDGLPDGLSPEAAAKVVAKVGDRTITVEDVTRQINRLSPYIRRRWAAPEKRKEFLDKLVRVELLSQEAERLGLTEDPEVQRTAKQVMIRLMIKNDLEKNVFPTQIEDAELQAEYDKEKEKYKRPEQVRASHIVVKNRPDAEKLLASLKENASDAKFFREQAREHSVDNNTKTRGGDIGYFSRPGEKRDDEPEVDKAVADAAWALENKGDISDQIVKTDMGFHIIKLTNKRSEMNRSFDSVKRMIENRLLRERRAEAMKNFIDDLKAKAQIEMFDENIAKLDFKVEQGAKLPGPPERKPNPPDKKP